MLLLFLSVITLVGCSDDDPKDPEDTIPLNMMNEENGKTLLGESDVYINSSNNFKTFSCYIVDAGETSGLGANVQPMLNNLAQEVAVVPGHLYQVYDRDVFHDFPSGRRAILAETGYYKAYVVAGIANGTETTGAMVKYVITYPEINGLPEEEEVIGALDGMGDILEYELPQDGECDFVDSAWEYNEDAFDIQIKNNKLVIELLKNVDKVHGPYGEYNILIRSGSTYTIARINIGASGMYWE